MSGSIGHPSSELRRPGSNGELFRAFNRLALQGFGGVLPIAQRELVERQRWLTQAEFVELLATAQVLPGPNVVNLAIMFGDRVLGWRGALAAFGGMMLAPLVIVIAMAVVYAELASHPVVAGALRGMGAVAAGLVLATAVKLAGTLRQTPIGAWAGSAIAIVSGLAVGVLQWPFAWVVLAAGSVGIALAWRAWKPAVVAALSSGAPGAPGAGQLALGADRPGESPGDDDGVPPPREP